MDEVAADSEPAAHCGGGVGVVGGVGEVGGVGAVGGVGEVDGVSSWEAVDPFTESATAFTTPATGSGSFWALCLTVSLRFATVSCTVGECEELLGLPADLLEPGAPGLGAEHIADAGRRGRNEDSFQLHGGSTQRRRGRSETSLRRKRPSRRGQVHGRNADGNAAGVAGSEHGGPAARGARAGSVEEVWDRYTTLARWPEWSPQISRVEASADRLALGVRGTVYVGGVLPLPFTVTSCRPEDRTWSWQVRLGPVTLDLDHAVYAAGSGTRTTLSLPDRPWSCWLRASGSAGAAPTLCAEPSIAQTARRDSYSTSSFQRGSLS